MSGRKKNLRGLSMENKLKLISPEAAISVRWQSDFLGGPRSNLYYTRKIEFSQEDLEMMRLMDEWHTKDSTFGFGGVPFFL